MVTVKLIWGGLFLKVCWFTSLLRALTLLLSLSAIPSCIVLGEDADTADAPCIAHTDGLPQALPSACTCGALDIPKVGEDFPFQSDDPPRSGGTLTGHVYSNLPSLMYLMNSDAWVWYATVHHVYESLVRQDARDYQIRPELATHWEMEDEGRTWTFHLREGVKWHDGAPFTAADVLFTFETIMDTRNRTAHMRGIYQDMLDPINPYETPDDFTFVLHLKVPSFTFLQELNNTIIIPKHIFERGDFNSHPNIRAPIGTGPFKFVEWTSEELKFTRNNDYWGAKAYLEHLVFKIVTDFETAFLMLKRGDLDLMTRLRPHQRSEGVTEHVLEDYNLVEYLVSAYAYMVWNTRNPVFADKRTRQAMSYVIPTDRIICEIYQCLGDRVTGTMPTTHPAYKKGLKPYPYDPQRARELLEEAGWTDTDNDGIRDKIIDGVKVPFSFTFMLSATSRTMEQQITIIQSAAQRIGVEILISKVDWSVYVQRLREGDYQAAGLRWIMSHENDPYNLFHSEGPQNYAAWKNEEADKILKKTTFMQDADLRNVLYRRFHEIFYDEQPYTLLFAPVLSGLASKSLGGIYSSDNFYQWNELFINDEALPVVAPADRFPGSPGGPDWSRFGTGQLSP